MPLYAQTELLSADFTVAPRRTELAPAVAPTGAAVDERAAWGGAADTETVRAASAAFDAAGRGTHGGDTNTGEIDADFLMALQLQSEDEAAQNERVLAVASDAGRGLPASRLALSDDAAAAAVRAHYETGARTAPPAATAASVGGGAEDYAWQQALAMQLEEDELAARMHQPPPRTSASTPARSVAAGARSQARGSNGGGSTPARGGTAVSTGASMMHPTEGRPYTDASSEKPRSRERALAWRFDHLRAAADCTGGDEIHARAAGVLPARAQSRTKGEVEELE